MKKLVVVALAAVMVSCASSTPDTTGPEGDLSLPPDAASVPGESDTTLSSDPFLSPDGDSQQTADANLATPPSEEPSLPPADAPSAPPATAEAAPSDSLPPPSGDASDNVASSGAWDGSTSGDSSSAAAPSAAPAASASAGNYGTEVPPPPPLPQMPESTPNYDMPAASATADADPIVPPTTPGGGSPRNLRQDYKEYQDRMDTRANMEDELAERALFAHEGGAWQIGLDYAHNAFADFDVDTSATVSKPDTQGGEFSLTYFPLRSLDLGRLGVGARGGAYWSEFESVAGTTPISNKKLSFTSYGARLTYEFQYWIGQTFVPFAYYGYNQVAFRGYSEARSGVNYAKRTFGSTNYGGGLSINLNRLEASAASKALASTGIRKFYLSYTFQQRSDDENTGTGHYLGLRFEY